MALSWADINNALSETHNEPIENIELLGKTPNCEEYVPVAAESRAGTVTPTQLYLF